jgi:hypothetical protein
MAVARDPVFETAKAAREHLACYVPAGGRTLSQDAVTEIERRIAALPEAERRELLRRLQAGIVGASGGRPRRFSEFRGRGREVWSGVDTQQYLDELRDEWPR